MSYVPNASDASEPVGSRFVSSAAEEFRTLKQRVNNIASNPGGGGGGSVTLGGITIPNFSIDQSTTNGRIEFIDTNPMGWNAGAGRMDLQFDFYSTNYFTRNPDGHLAIVLRCDTSVIGTAVRGQGMLMGNVAGAPLGSDLVPTGLLETWHNSVGGNPQGNTLFPNSESARSKGGVKDNTQYRVQVTATKTNAGTRHLRYSLWSWEPTWQRWIHEVDTGDVLDANVWVDLTSYGLAFGHVFATAGQTWQLNFTNVKVVWGPCETFTPDQTTKLSRFGAELDGNLKFLGAGRRTFIRSADATPANWNLFAAYDGPNTRVAAAPGGGGTNSEFVAFSAITADYTGAAIGMSGSRGYIRTYRNGAAAAVPLDFWLEGAVRATMTASDLTLFQNLNFNGTRRIATTDWLALDVAGSAEVMVWKTNSIKLRGASVELMTVMSRMEGIVNWDNAHAAGFGTSSGPLNWTELCAPAGVAGYIGASYNRDLIENVIRPLYCVVGNMMAELRNRRILKYHTD